DRIADRKNSYAKIYDPARFTPLKSAEKFVAESLNVAAEYVKDYVKGAETKNWEEIEKGEGKTVEHDGHKLAAHRDETGKLHVISAICTHLACVVHWNNAEKSWDCPCHGSRFTVDGEIIEGPALKPLKNFKI